MADVLCGESHNGEAARECPTPNVMANKSPKATQSPVGIGRGQESMKHVSVQFATKKNSLPASSARQIRASTVGCAVSGHGDTTGMGIAT
jgi:hypothetical protein